MFVDQVLLVLSACALGGAALRAAAQITVTSGDRAAPAEHSVIERLLVAAPLAAGFAVCWTLALGRFGLAGTVGALAAGPIAAWAASRWLLPAPRFSIAAELVSRWNGAARTPRAVALALVGLSAGCVFCIARRPGFDVDALGYHLPDVLGWLHSGHAGSVQTFTYDFPVGYYPVTNEVLLTWLVGISRSFAPLAAWSTACAALALAAMWRLLHLLRVPRMTAVFAVVAFATLPIIAIGLNLDGAGTDTPAVLWLACTAALSAGAAARPALLAPALLAAGLGIGTKTTVAPLAIVALLWGIWLARSQLKSSRWLMIAGAGGALLVGGPWYVRNVVTHGWPLWPFSSGPTGDPLPHAMAVFHVSFLSRAGPTVSALRSSYLKTVAGGLGLMLGALAIPLLARSKAALVAAAVGIMSVLLWASAPFTGAPAGFAPGILTLSTVRYLLPALGACAVALAIAARDVSGLRHRLIIAVLGAATVGSLVADLSLPYPQVPSPKYLIVGVLVGGGVGMVAPGNRLPLTPSSLRIAGALLALVALAVSAPGWLGRESRDGSYDQALLAFMLHQPGFASGSQPIAFAPVVLATLAGANLRHPISLLPAQAPCDLVQEQLKRGWIVLWPNDYTPGVSAAFDAASCLRRDVPIYDEGGALIYSSASIR